MVEFDIQSENLYHAKERGRREGRRRWRDKELGMYVTRNARGSTT
jgi:hypothetical protein